VSRPHATVRRVTPELESYFTGLWISARVEAGASPESASRAAGEGKVCAALARDDVRAYLAFGDETPTGYMVLTDSPLSGLTDSPCVSIDQLYVVPESRRTGVARALLTAAATYADRHGCEQIASAVPAQGREANRFFARLGFSSYVVRRVTSTAALRRKLSGEEQHPGLDQVLLRRRRSLRARAMRTNSSLLHG